jgi:cytochrome c-type biogenesis protein CcmH/NrfG
LNVDIGLTPGAEEERIRARIAENPDDVNSMIVLADLLSNTGRGVESIQWFERAIEARPNDISLRVAFARALSRSSFNADAEIQLQHAINQQADHAESLFVLGELYENWTPPRLDDAKVQYQRILEVAPESPYAEQAQQRLDELQ